MYITLKISSSGVQHNFVSYYSVFISMDREGEQNEESRTEGKTEEIDIDLNDPEVEKAATMIQKSYRGFHVRKTLQPDKDVSTDLETVHL